MPRSRLRTILAAENGLTVLLVSLSAILVARLVALQIAETSPSPTGAGET